MTDKEIVTRLKNSGIGEARLADIIGVSETQIKLILNFVCIITPKTRKIILSKSELQELWHY